MNKPICELLGGDGNVFAIIGSVTKALKKDGQNERAAEFASKAMTAGSYDAVLQLLFEYVEPY